jgi:hypothetical protein
MRHRGAACAKCMHILKYFVIKVVDTEKQKYAKFQTRRLKISAETNSWC